MRTDNSFISFILPLFFTSANALAADRQPSVVRPDPQGISRVYGKSAKKLVKALENSGVKGSQQIEGKTWFVERLACSSTFDLDALIPVRQCDLSVEGETISVKEEAAVAMFDAIAVAGFPLIQQIEGKHRVLLNVSCASEFNFDMNSVQYQCVLQP